MDEYPSGWAIRWTAFAGIMTALGGLHIAVLSALIAVGWLPSYPVWAIIFVALSMFVIWAGEQTICNRSRR